MWHLRVVLTARALPASLVVRQMGADDINVSPRWNTVRKLLLQFLISNFAQQYPQLRDPALFRAALEGACVSRALLVLSNLRHDRFQRLVRTKNCSSGDYTK